MATTREKINSSTSYFKIGQRAFSSFSLLVTSSVHLLPLPVVSGVIMESAWFESECEIHRRKSKDSGIGKEEVNSILDIEITLEHNKYYSFSLIS